jgi:uncharacterized protein YndB with AHSA1/START domain
MSDSSTKHDTLVFERVFTVPPARVYSAYADVDQRARWSAPSESAGVVYSSSDFRIGGEDRFRCGDKHDLRYVGVLRYEDLVDNERIVYCERIATDAVPLAVSLVTWELSANGVGTRLRVTAQVTSFVGADMIDGTRAGTNAALDNLAVALSPPAT